MNIKYFKLIIMIVGIIQTGCVSLSSKTSDSSAVNDSAKTRGFVDSPQSAARLRMKQGCDAPASLKWELEFDKSTPLVEEPGSSANGSAYAPYRVICFAAKFDGETKIKLVTKHLGNSSGKAFYARPYFFLFNDTNSLVKPSHDIALSQETWSGNYVFETEFSLRKDQVYYLFVGSNNLYPDAPWASHPNYNMGLAAGAFPVDIYPSVFGKVAVQVGP